MVLYNFKTREGRQKFYQSKEWWSVRDRKRKMDRLCERCLKEGRAVVGRDIHHKKDLREITEVEDALEINGLETLCKECHQKETNKSKKETWKVFNLKDFMEKNGIT